MKPIDWAREHGATMTDGTSFRHMRTFALSDIAENDRIRGLLVDRPDDLADWNRIADVEDAESREAIAIIDARVTELGYAPLGEPA